MDYRKCRASAGCLSLFLIASAAHAQQDEQPSLHIMATVVFERGSPDDKAMAERVLDLTERRIWTYRVNGRERTAEGSYGRLVTDGGRPLARFENRIRIHYDQLIESDQRLIDELENMRGKLKRRYDAVPRSVPGPPDFRGGVPKPPDSRGEYDNVSPPPTAKPEGYIVVPDNERAEVKTSDVLDPETLKHYGIDPNEIIQAIDGEEVTEVELVLIRLMDGPPIVLHLRDPISNRTRDFAIIDQESTTDIQAESVEEPDDSSTDNLTLNEDDRPAVEWNEPDLPVIASAQVSGANGITFLPAMPAAPIATRLSFDEWETAPFLAIFGGLCDSGGISGEPKRGAVYYKNGDYLYKRGIPNPLFDVGHGVVRYGIYREVRDNARYTTIPRLRIEYYGHWEKDKAIDHIRTHVQEFGGRYRIPLVIVGHSWGGSTAYSLAGELPHKIPNSPPVELLVTLDGVNRWDSFHANNIGKTSKPIRTNRWVNIYCKSDFKYFKLKVLRDAIFQVSGRWSRESAASRNIRVGCTHGNASQMYLHAEEEILKTIQPDRSVIFVNLSPRRALLATLSYQHEGGQVTGDVLFGCDVIEAGKSVAVSRYHRYAVFRADYSGNDVLVNNWNLPASELLPIDLTPHSMKEVFVPVVGKDRFRQSKLAVGWTLASFYQFGRGIYPIHAVGGVRANAFHLLRVNERVRFASHKKKWHGLGQYVRSKNPPPKQTKLPFQQFQFIASYSSPLPDIPTFAPMPYDSLYYRLIPSRSTLFAFDYDFKPIPRVCPKGAPRFGHLAHFHFKVSGEKTNPFYRFVKDGERVRAMGMTEGFKVGGTSSLSALANIVGLGGRDKCFVDGVLTCQYVVANPDPHKH